MGNKVSKQKIYFYNDHQYYTHEAVKKVYIDPRTGIQIKKKIKKLILVLMHNKLLILDNYKYLLCELNYTNIMSWKADVISKCIKISYLGDNNLIILKCKNPKSLSQKLLNITEALANNNLRRLYNLEGYNYDSYSDNSSDEEIDSYHETDNRSFNSYPD
jgi:hypothetical protein